MGISISGLGQKGVCFSPNESAGNPVSSASPVDKLITDLRSTDANVREDAAFKLSKLGKEAKQAVPALTEALKDDNPLVLLSVVEALKNMGKYAESAIPSLLNAVNKVPIQNQHILIALIEIGKETVPSMLEAFKIEDKLIRHCVAIVLVNVGIQVPNIIPLLEKNALENSSPIVREYLQKVVLDNIKAKTNNQSPTLSK